MGLNLDTTKSADSQTAIDLSEKIPLTEFKRSEQLVPSQKPRPTQVSLPYDPMRKQKFIVFDTETTCTGKAAELCQISATSKDGKHEFSHYILPRSNISTGASLVNNLTIKSIIGKRTMCKSNSPVLSVNPGKALQDFITFLKQLQDKDSNSTLVLIGHNSATFNVPILLRNSGRTFQYNLTEMNVNFANSQQLVKSLIKHTALLLGNGGFCKPNQRSLYVHLFNEEFDAHDALEDVRALRRILFDSPLNLSTEDIVKRSSVTSVSHAIENMYLDRRHELLLTFSNKLFNASDNNGPVKKALVQNIAGSSLSYNDLRNVYSRFGKKGVVAILSHAPSTL